MSSVYQSQPDVVHAEIKPVNNYSPDNVHVHEQKEQTRYVRTRTRVMTVQCARRRKTEHSDRKEKPCTCTYVHARNKNTTKNVAEETSPRKKKLEETNQYYSVW